MEDKDKRLLIVAPLLIGALFYQPLATAIGAGIIALLFVVAYLLKR